jgi:hypothetical protein
MRLTLTLLLVALPRLPAPTSTRAGIINDDAAVSRYLGVKPG